VLDLKGEVVREEYVREAETNVVDRDESRRDAQRRRANLGNLSEPRWNAEISRSTHILIQVIEEASQDEKNEEGGEEERTGERQ
jgi:hypothetical protein